MFQAIFVRAAFRWLGSALCPTDKLSLAASLLEIVGVGPKMAYLFLQATGQNVSE